VMGRLRSDERVPGHWTLPLAIGLIALIPIGLFGALVWLVVAIADEPEVQADPAALSRTMNRLRALRPDLAALDVPVLRGIDSTVRQDGCRSDSGSAEQPTITRDWDAPREVARRASGEIADALVAQGWTQTDDRFGYTLDRDFGGWRARIAVGDFADFEAAERVTVYAEARVDGATPCFIAAD
jgi:hypothetical protein